MRAAMRDIIRAIMGQSSGQSWRQPSGLITHLERIAHHVHERRRAQGGRHAPQLGVLVRTDGRDEQRRRRHRKELRRRYEAVGGRRCGGARAGGSAVRC
eukprot:5997016-Prymnesium_polylepis.1